MVAFYPRGACQGMGCALTHLGRSSRQDPYLMKRLSLAAQTPWLSSCLIKPPAAVPEESDD